MPLTRAEIEKVVEPIIRRSLRELEYTVRRVSLILWMVHSLLAPQASGEGLEVGSAFGYLLFSAGVLLPGIRWTGLDFPGRTYRHPEAYEKALSRVTTAGLWLRTSAKSRFRLRPGNFQ